MKKFFFIIYLILITNKAFAEFKQNIIQNFEAINNISFNFEQNINGKKEDGNCTIQYPKKIYCNYNLKNKKIAYSLIGFSNTAEILKILIILFPNFIVIISWSILMLVIASQVVGIKQIYNLEKIGSAVGVVILSYVAQFFIIGFLVILLIKLAY